MGFNTDIISATTISGTTFYGDGSNLTGISGGGTFTGGTVSGATQFTNGVSATTISATTYINLPTYDYEIHVSTVDGNDTTGNGDLLNPVATITKALTLLTGSRKTIIIHPGTYSENVTVANTNTTISTSELTGANTLLSGTLTIGTLGSGTRISGLKMSSLVISGTAQAYISNCTVDTQVTKSSSGYVEIINSELQCTLGIQISGAGITIINGNKNVGVSVNDASAQVIIKGCNSVVTPSASAGNLAIVDCIVTALGGNGITITGSLTTLTLINSQVLVTAGNNVAPISVAGIYTIINTVYDKPGSTLTGTSTNSIDYFQYINADKFITQGGTSSKYVMGDGSLSNGFTGGTVTGSTSFTDGLSANTISATTISGVTFYGDGSNLTGISGGGGSFSGGTVTNPTNFTGGLSANTFSATTYQNLPTDVRVTGGTYSAGTTTFTNNTGGTFSITGFSTGYTYSQTNNYTSGIPVSITHNFGTTEVLVQIIDTNTNQQIFGNISNYQLNSFDVTLNSSLNGIKVVVAGGSLTSTTPRGSITLLFGHDSVSPSDSVSYFIGGQFNLAPVTSTSDGRRLITQKTGNITQVSISRTIGGTLGSSELNTLSINNVTQATTRIITSAATFDSSSSLINYTLTSPLPVVAGDKLEIEWDTPAYATNPTTVRQQINVLIDF
jgi:hypothetical protein